MHLRTGATRPRSQRSNRNSTTRKALCASRQPLLSFTSRMCRRAEKESRKWQAGDQDPAQSLDLLISLFQDARKTKKRSPEEGERFF